MAAERDLSVTLLRRFVERRRIRRLLLELDRASGCQRRLRATVTVTAHRRGV